MDWLQKPAWLKLLPKYANNFMILKILWRIILKKLLLLGKTKVCELFDSN